MRPWVILDEIEGIGCGQDSEGYLLSLDARVMRDAKKYKIPTIGLETPQIVDAHYQRLPVNTIIAMLKSLPTQRADYPHGAVGKAVIELLASENVVLAMLFETHVQMQYLDPRGVKLRDDFTNQKILGARNRAWMPALTRALSQGNAFVAVGAAHLGGNYGILPMLQRKGYKITRIALK